MAAGGGPRAWQFLKCNDGYAEARLSLADDAPAFQDAPFPIRRQTGADSRGGALGPFRLTCGFDRVRYLAI